MPERDGRVRCLYQEKPGVSAARNAALEICEGAYVMFLDGDDWIDENYFEMFVAAMEGVDLVSAGYRAYHEERITVRHIIRAFMRAEGGKRGFHSGADAGETLRNPPLPGIRLEQVFSDGDYPTASSVVS